MPEPEEMVTVFKTADVSLLMVVKSLLDSAKIDYFVQGEEALGLFPVGPAGGGLMGRALAAIVTVPPDKVEEAEALLKEVTPPDQPDKETG